MEVPRNDVRRDVQDPEVYFGIAEWGYGWVFPKRDTLTVGIGGLATENADMPRLFREFAWTALGAVPAQPVCGSPIPFGNFVARPGRGSTLLVGDAAGLVEPLTGEGIAFAVQSGLSRRAGDHRGHPLRVGGARARVSICRAIGPSRDRSRTFLLRRLVFSRYTKRMFLRALSGNAGLVIKHMDVLAGEADYRDYARFALPETLAHLPQIVRAGFRPRARCISAGAWRRSPAH